MKVLLKSSLSSNKGIVILLFSASLFGKAGKSFAQNNLVINGDFEQYSSCPTDYDQINHAIGWDTLRAGGGAGAGGAEYDNKCASCCMVGVPRNVGGYQWPHAGLGYMSFACFLGNPDDTIGNHLDYVQGTLKNQLTAGKAYCVSFYVNRSNFFIYAIDELAAYLDDGSVKTAYNGVAHVIPQVKSPTGVIITDTLAWTQIEGSFTANGTEQYITIGNFRNFAQTTYDSLPSICATCTAAYYNLDDVSVTELGALASAGKDTTITQGDTAFVGVHDIGAAYTWYANGTAFYNGAEAGLYVTPSITTTYIVKQTQCSLVSYDTCVVTVKPVSVRELGSEKVIKIWPNPIKEGILHIENVKGVDRIEFYNMLGQKVLVSKIVGSIDVSSLTPGLYFVHIINTVNNESIVKKLLIQQ